MNEPRVPRTHAEALPSTASVSERRVPGRDLSATELELRQEMAAALGRMGELLDGQIQTLGELGQVIAAMPAGPARDAERAKYQAHRAKAEEYQWFMVVQREALGLTDHSALYEHYKIPALS